MIFGYCCCWLAAQESGEPFLNLKGCTLQYEHFKKAVILRNLDKRTVASYTAACVASNAGKTKIIAKFKAVKDTILPGDTLYTIIVDSKAPVDVCTEKKLQIAIVSINFKNNEEWHFNASGEDQE